MDKSKAKVPVILGVAAFLFFALVYPNHMRFAEQYQMFLFTGEYFCSFFNRPGGFAAYLGAFFTQFAYIPALGALVYALFISLTSFLAGACIDKALSRQSWSLQILPTTVLFCMMCNENFKLSAAVAFVMLMAFILLVIRTDSSIILVVGQALLYWLAGGIAIQAVILLPAYAYFCGHKAWKSFLLAAVSSAVAFLPAIFLCQYPPLRLLFGTEYFRFPVLFAGQWFFCLAMLLPLAIHKYRWMRVLALVGCAVLLAVMPDMKKERTMRYDHLAYRGKFNEIIKLAEKKNPQTRIQMNCLNLALAATSKINRLYDFPQNGVQGIMPPYSRDFFIYVSETDIDPFLSYRKIAPGFEIHSKMGLYCRDLTSYREKVVFENTAITGSCINCHSFNAGDQSQVTLHVRGTKGGTLIRDENTLFFARARLRPMPDEYDSARYNLCCTSFEDGKIGDETRTLVDAETDSWRILDEVCSPETDSWHSWSSNGSGWFCFASRRDDGLHTRVYFSMINPDGTATKPFMLPQRSPDKYYTRLFYSYNIPEFSSSEFKLDIDDLTQEKKTIGQR